MAVINTTFGFAFVHVPKAAGTSVSALLNRFNTVLDIEIGGSSFGEAVQPAYRRRFGLSKHATAAEIIKLIGESRWQRLLSFGVVRHPVDRLASAFRFLRSWDSPENQQRELVKAFGSFRDFVESDIWVDHGGHDRMFRAQAFWLADQQDRVLVDRVIHLEGLEAGLLATLRDAGIPPGKLQDASLQQLNTTSRSGELSADALPRACLEKIERRYARDYRLFGFERSSERAAATASAPRPATPRAARRQALFIDDSVPTPDRDAGSNAALQHMLLLQELGYAVDFIPADNMARIEPYTSELEKLGIRSRHAPDFSSVKDVLEKGAQPVDLVYVHRYANASKYITAVRQQFPNAFVIYSVADLHHLRQERELQVEGSLKAGAARISKADEAKALRAADVVIVHSHVEAALIRKSYPRIRVSVVPWPIKLQPVAKPFAERSGYAFVGGYRHRPNVDAAIHLAQHIVPRILERNPRIEGVLIGPHSPPEITALDSASLRVLGHVPELTVALHKLRCTVAPLRYGAGLKGKVLESLAHGIPCVMSPLAAEGMALPKALGWLVADSPEAFAEKVAQLHDEPRINDKMSREGMAYVDMEFNRAKVASLLQKMIPDPGL